MSAHTGCGQHGWHAIETQDFRFGILFLQGRQIGTDAEEVLP